MLPPRLWRARRHGEVIEIEVVTVHEDLQFVNAFWEMDGDTHISPDLRAAGGRERDGSRDVGSVEFQMQAPVGIGSRNSERDRVISVAGNVHGIAKPLSGPNPADVVAATDIGRLLDVDIVLPVGTTRVAVRGVEVPDILAT